MVNTIVLLANSADPHQPAPIRSRLILVSTVSTNIQILFPEYFEHMGYGEPLLFHFYNSTVGFKY